MSEFLKAVGFLALCSLVVALIFGVIKFVGFLHGLHVNAESLEKRFAQLDKEWEEFKGMQGLNRHTFSYALFQAECHKYLAHRKFLTKEDLKTSSRKKK